MAVGAVSDNNACDSTKSNEGYLGKEKENVTGIETEALWFNEVVVADAMGATVD